VHFLILALAAAQASAQVFKWVDERGITHYGERPPQGAKATEVQDKLASPPPGRAAASPAQKTETRAAQPGQVPTYPQPTGVPPPSAAPKAPPTPQELQAAAKRAECDKERAALDLLKRGGTSYSFDANGEKVKIDNSAAITEQEKRVSEHCAN
jgi:hypothetical protein